MKPSRVPKYKDPNYVPGGPSDRLQEIEKEMNARNSGEDEPLTQEGGFAAPRVRKANDGVEENEAVDYDNGDQSFADGGAVLPEEDDIEGQDIPDDNPDDEEPDDGLDAEPAGLSGDTDMDQFAANAPLPLDEGDENADDGSDDDGDATPQAVRTALEYGRKQVKGPESAPRGVLPAPDVEAALHAATDDPEKMAAQQDANMSGYLSGKDAYPQEQVQALERSVDPQGTMDPDLVKTKAIAAAEAQGGPQAAWGVMQYYRQKFDAYRSFAAAAAAGGEGKPPDLYASAQAATRAFQHLPNGQRVSFTPTRNGMRVRSERVEE